MNHKLNAATLTNDKMNPENRTLLPRIAFTSFTSRYEEPTLKEGFQDIVPIDFVFRGNEEQKALWGKYWIN